VETAQEVSDPGLTAEERSEPLIDRGERPVQEMGKAARTPFLSLSRTLGEVGLEETAPLANEPIVVQRHHYRDSPPCRLPDAGGGKIHQVMKVYNFRGVSIEKGAKAPGDRGVEITERESA
jgi:hypothetical protein